MAYNEQGLLLCWYFITSSPELQPNRITDVEVKNKSLIELRKLGLKLIREQKDEDISGSQHSSKPHVGRCLF